MAIDENCFVQNLRMRSPMPFGAIGILILMAWLFLRLDHRADGRACEYGSTYNRGAMTLDSKTSNHAVAS